MLITVGTTSYDAPATSVSVDETPPPKGKQEQKKKKIEKMLKNCTYKINEKYCLIF